MANNATLFDAALAGATQGLIAGRPLSSAVAADYTNLTAQAKAIATEVDSLIAAGSPTVPQANLLRAITAAAMTGRTPILTAAGNSTTAADYAAIAGEIVACYMQVSAQLV